MNIGIVEVAFVLIVMLLTVLAVWKTKLRWLGALPLFAVVATVASPADIASTVVIAIPNGIVYVVAVSWVLRSQSDDLPNTNIA